MQQMKKGNLTNTELREQIKKGLDLTFKKLLKSKRQTDGFLVLSEGKPTTNPILI
jgi:hypothetical protein